MIRYFASHPTAANIAMIAILVLGVMALPNLLRETFPRIEPRRVEVRVAYPGATPAEVEEAVCRRVEDAVDGVENVEQVTCEASESLAVATIEMVAGRDLALFTSDIETEIDGVDDFPDAAEDPIISQLGRTDFVASLAISGVAPATELKAYAEDVKARLLAFESAEGPIPQVAIRGFADRQIRVELRDVAARRLGLSINDVTDKIAQQSVDLPAGEIESRDGVVTLRFADQRRSLDEFRDLIIASGATGAEIRLGDVATVTDRFEKDEAKILVDGRRAALLEITKTPREDSLRVVAAVEAFLTRERVRAPPGVIYEITRDGSSLVADRIQLIVTNAAQGLALVFLAMLVFFGLRQAVWISIGLPVSFLGAIAAMIWIDYSINMLTLVGLLIVIGILMDDAIVIAENIETRREKGDAPLDAAVNGALEVAPGVLSSFVTTTVVFGSLAFLEGDIGEVLRVVPVVMLLVLVVSLVEAFLILPNHLGHGGADPAAVRRLRAASDRWLAWLRERAVGPAADWAVRWRYLTLGLSVMAFLGALALLAGGALKFEAFPEIDGDTLEARIELRQGAPLSETEAVVAEVVAALGRVDAALSPEQPDGARLVETVVARFNENPDVGVAGAHLALVQADMLTIERRAHDNDAILAAWRAETPETLDVARLNFTESTLGPAGRAIELRLRGPDVAQLELAAAELIEELSRYAGAHSLADDLSPGKPERRIRLKEGASALGLDANAIARQLRAAFLGTTAEEIQIGVEDFEVDVRLAAEDRDTLADLDLFTVRTPSGALAPLTAVAEVTEGRGYAKLRRVDGAAAVTVTGDVDTRLGNANEIVSTVLSEFAPGLEARYPGLKIDVEGQNNAAAETQTSMLRGALIGLIAVYLLLSFQFRSYVEPIVVMTVIPFSLVGAVLGHLALGIDLSLPSMLGLVSLAGIVVNDSILLVNRIKDGHAPGTTVAEAAPEAARARFRAILLTSVTTVAGVLPLLFETSLQAQILIPLVTSIGFGLLATTVLILFVAPPFYAILDDFGLTSLAAERRALRRA
ncbi:MAG: efflux RND transporter permease subunit, partial [Pseudomonadota bacterium]